MQPADQALIRAFLEAEKLPPEFADLITEWYLPLAGQLMERRRRLDRPLIVGINGAQGTGKSTLANFLTLMLSEQQLRIANLSLDDLYLSSGQRRNLAADVHPLLASRGVPGTHDLELARQVMLRLADPHSDGQVLLPRFDKAEDEPRPLSEWEAVDLPVDVVVLEGWFLGLQPESAETLDKPVNSLEADEDRDGIWRRYVNTRLHAYQPLFAEIDFLVMLKAPSFDCVYRWRSLQEQKLAAATGGRGSKVMDGPTLDRFIQHFERLTRHCLAELPDRADLVFELDENHHITHSQPALH
ncbi:MAG: hypothetical protein R3F41_06440 [Gammaproteobacteria bacterium]|nr:hypothetical protein [Pseudomonadales bacterium]MCP5348554.1 hypothetical protein [Pseudomonadales bacterium]